MNTPSNTFPESFEAQTVAPTASTAVRSMYWSIRRELWESRSIYIAPLAAAVVFLLGFLISMVRLPQKMRALSALDAAHQREAIAMPYDMAAGLLMLTAMIVGMFYCLGAFQGERHDRSILFWKSLPVSDLTTVLSKASIPFVVLPLLTFAITVATQWIMLLLSTVVLWANGPNAATLWMRLSFIQMSLYLLYHLVTVHALWQAPIYGWLLLVSAWARRAAFLWAVLPLLAIGAVERIAFNTSHFAGILENRFSGGGAEALTMPGTFPMNPMTHLTPGTYLSSSGLWIGVIFTAVCIAAAVRLRRYRGPI
jgi:ABC-2 type transport system permease protein